MKYAIFSFWIIAAAAWFETNQASRLLTLADATNIMGEPCSLTANTVLKKADTMEYKCEYTARSHDITTAKTGKLYFMYEIYSSAAAAAKAYTAIYNANAGHNGAQKVAGIGSEAYYHTDHTGFYFFLVRKKEKMFRLKLNKITSHSSETAFKTAAKNIVSRL